MSDKVCVSSCGNHVGCHGPAICDRLNRETWLRTYSGVDVRRVPFVRQIKAAAEGECSQKVSHQAFYERVSQGRGVDDKNPGTHACITK